MIPNLSLLSCRIARKDRTTWILLAGTIFLPLLMTPLVSYEVIQHEPLLSSFFWETWIIIGFVGCLGMGLALIPSSLMILLSGYYLGFHALPGALIACVIASWVGFQLAGWANRNALVRVIEQVYPKQTPLIKQLQNGITHHQLGLTALVRMSSVLPFAVTNTLLPMMGVSLRNYLLGGLIGFLPRVAFLLWIGTQAHEVQYLMNQEKSVTIQLLTLGAVVGITLGIGYYGKRSFSRQIKQATA